MKSFIRNIVPSENEINVLRSIVEFVRPLAKAGNSHVAVACAEEQGLLYKDSLSRIAVYIQELLEHKGNFGVAVIDLRAIFDPSKISRTPVEFPQRSEHIIDDLNIVQCAFIGAVGGFSYSYSGQANGTLCDDVMPLFEHRNHLGFSSGLEVGWHTEDASFNRFDNDNLHPTFDILSMAYLRNPNGDPTVVSMPDFSLMSDEMISNLKLNQFVSKTSISHGGDTFALDEPTSFVYSDNKIRFSFARLHEIEEIYKENGQFETIEYFNEILNKSQAAIPAMPGSLAFIDNMRVAHGRGNWKVAPSFNGADRWHRRLGFANANRRKYLESLMFNPNERIIDSGLLIESFKKYVQNSTVNPVVS